MMTKVTKLIESFAGNGTPKIEGEDIIWEPVTRDFNCLTINENKCETEVLPEKEVLDVWNSIFEEEGIQVSSLLNRFANKVFNLEVCQHYFFDNNTTKNGTDA